MNLDEAKAKAKEIYGERGDAYEHPTGNPAKRCTIGRSRGKAGWAPGTAISGATFDECFAAFGASTERRAQRAERERKADEDFVRDQIAKADEPTLQRLKERAEKGEKPFKDLSAAITEREKEHVQARGRKLEGAELAAVSAATARGREAFKKAHEEHEAKAARGHEN